MKNKAINPPNKANKFAFESASFISDDELWAIFANNSESYILTGNLEKSLMELINIDVRGRFYLISKSYFFYYLDTK